MAKDAVATMGTILSDDVGGRDAVHVAVISAEAAGQLMPGQHVGRAPDSTPDHLLVGYASEPIGIVDPFLVNAVQKGQRFWLYLYPRTITSLRHNWTHPAFADAPVNTIYAPPSQKITAEQWIKNYAESEGLGYHELMVAADAAVSDGEEYVLIRGHDAHGTISGEFWTHYELATGRKVERRPEYFSCSC